MTNFTTVQLTGKLVVELRTIAKELKIALSSQGKKLTKPQLIAAIMEAQPKVKKVKVLKQEAVQAVETTVAELNVNNLSTIVKEAKQLLNSANVPLVDSIELVQKAMNDITINIRNEKRNKLQIAQMSRTVNMLKALLTIKRKEVAY